MALAVVAAAAAVGGVADGTVGGGVEGFSAWVWREKARGRVGDLLVLSGP